MPLYMDIHELEPGTSAEELRDLHEADLAVQQKLGVEYVSYWHNERANKVFCLVEAPTAEAAEAVHREAHGLVADKIIEVAPDLVEGFLGSAVPGDWGEVRAPGGGGRDSGVRTILFTDIVESTSLTQRVGDEAAMAFLGLHNEIVRGALADHGGREVKHTGDGIMASFPSAASAVRSAIRIQQQLAERNVGAETPVHVRIGATSGEPVEQERDLFGASVQLAARLCSEAQPEQILVSSVVADLCIGKGLPFEARGEVSAKGFDDPIRVHAVRWA